MPSTGCQPSSANLRTIESSVEHPCVSEIAAALKPCSANYRSVDSLALVTMLRQIEYRYQLAGTRCQFYLTRKLNLGSPFSRSPSAWFLFLAYLHDATIFPALNVRCSTSNPSSQLSSSARSLTPLHLFSLVNNDRLHSTSQWKILEMSWPSNIPTSGRRGHCSVCATPLYMRQNSEVSCLICKFGILAISYETA